MYVCVCVWGGGGGGGGGLLMKMEEHCAVLQLTIFEVFTQVSIVVYLEPS